MNLTNLGVQELNAKEIMEVDGGSIYWWLELWGGLNFIKLNYGLTDDNGDPILV